MDKKKALSIVFALFIALISSPILILKGCGG